MPLFKLTYKRGKSLERSSMTVACTGLLSAWELGQKLARSFHLQELEVQPTCANPAWNFPVQEQLRQGEL